jgi:excisionase family DNA binding protein
MPAIGETVMSAFVDAFLAELSDEDLAVLAARLAPLIGAGEAGPEPWLTVADAAGYLRCQPQRIYNLVSQGRLQHAKDGSRVLFRRSWLDEWVSGGAK